MFILLGHKWRCVMLSMHKIEAADREFALWVALQWFPFSTFCHMHTRVTFIPPHRESGEAPWTTPDTYDSDAVTGPSQSLATLVTLSFTPQAATPQQAQRGPRTNVRNNGNVLRLTVGIIIPVNIYYSYIPMYLFGCCLIRGGGSLVHSQVAPRLPHNHQLFRGPIPFS